MTAGKYITATTSEGGTKTLPTLDHLMTTAMLMAQWLAAAAYMITDTASIVFLVRLDSPWRLAFL